MKDKFSDLEYISTYSSKMQDEFKKFVIQNKFYELIANKQKMSIEPVTREIDLAHNHYVNVIYNIQLLKLALIGDQLTQAVKSKNFLSYALAGRSLLEHIAVWRYFLVEKYAKVIRSGQEISFEDFHSLIDIHKNFLYGARFDWFKWLGNDFSGLESAYLHSVSDKKNKKNSAVVKQNISINVLTCIEKMSSTLPKFGIYYEMFCDLVHPNFGSNIFLGGISSSDGIVLDTTAETQLGVKLIEATFGELISLTYGHVNELTKSHFSFLIGVPLPKFLAVDFSKP
jgi:hypothetical protein